MPKAGTGRSGMSSLAGAHKVARARGAYPGGRKGFSQPPTNMPQSVFAFRTSIRVQHRRNRSIAVPQDFSTADVRKLTQIDGARSAGRFGQPDRAVIQAALICVHLRTSAVEILAVADPNDGRATGYLLAFKRRRAEPDGSPPQSPRSRAATYPRFHVGDKCTSFITTCGGKQAI